MTEAQWLLEYHGLRKKEEGEAELVTQAAVESLKAIKRMLIGLLGLDLAPPDPRVGEDAPDPDSRPIVPLSLLVGQPEVISEYLTEAMRKPVDSDEDFEELSAQLHQHLKTGHSDLPPDMMPLLTKDLDELQADRWTSAEAEAAMEAMGIKMRSADRPPVPHVKARPKRVDDGGLSILADRELREEIAELERAPRVDRDKEHAAFAAELQRYRNQGPPRK